MSYGTLQIEKMTTESGYSLGAGNSTTFKNKIINGGMSIDQRFGGASFTPTDGSYGLDRMLMSQSTAGKYTCQQNAGSVTPPLGFAYYMGMTSTSAFSIGTTDFYGFQQRIEGYNFNDWGWGTANAKNATLSFWVYSSLTGTFGGAIRSGNYGIAYIFSYTISSANTWQYVTVPIAGPTTGAWGGSTGSGCGVLFAIACGTGYQDTPGSWLSGSGKLAPTGQTSVVGTNGATFYITGIQFEVGTVATSFEQRPYGTELALCQRYFISLGGDSAYQGFAAGIAGSTTSIFYTLYNLPVSMRSSPSVAISGAFRLDDGYSSSFSVTGVSTSQMGTSVGVISVSVASGLTTGRFYQLQANNSTASRLQFSSEL